MATLGIGTNFLEQLRNTDWNLVVVGRGYSGLTNCVTRLRGGRLPEHTVLVGLQDPWRRYVDHPMGQFPSLLSLPGYASDAHPRGEPSDRFLSSRRFALQNRLELLRLRRDTGISEVNCFIDSPLSFVNNRWIIPLQVAGRSVTLKTSAVDFCTGPGPARILSPGGERIYGPWEPEIRNTFDASLLQELMDGVEGRIVVAEAFMRHRVIRDRILIVGEGPLAASAAEHALRKGATEVNCNTVHLD